jgi:hypothetical protein
MRARFAIYLAFAVLFVSGQLVQPAMAATAAHVGEACDTLGTTTLDKDHSSIVACVLTTPNEVATTCAAGGGCSWKSMHGGGNCQTQIDACKAAGYPNTACAIGTPVSSSNVWANEVSDYLMLPPEPITSTFGATLGGGAGSIGFYQAGNITPCAARTITTYSTGRLPARTTIGSKGILVCDPVTQQLSCYITGLTYAPAEAGPVGGSP